MIEDDEQMAKDGPPGLARGIGAVNMKPLSSLGHHSELGENLSGQQTASTVMNDNSRRDQCRAEQVHVIFCADCPLAFTVDERHLDVGVCSGNGSITFELRKVGEG